MTRWEDMWHDLEHRIEEALHAPVGEPAKRVLDWVETEMATVWNEHRMDSE